MKRNRSRTPKPPGTLSEVSKKFWRTVMSGWELEPHHVALLEIACQAWDRSVQATTAVAVDGAYYVDRLGARKAHPAIVIELQARKQFIATLREIGLDAKAPEGPRAPLLPHYRPAGMETRGEVN